MNDQLSLVVPCRNEARRLRPDAFCAFVDGNPAVQLVFVDDGSNDETARVLNTIRLQSPERVAVLTLDRHRGKGEAVRTGMRHCLEHHSADAIGYWDADLASPLEESIRLADLLHLHAETVGVLGVRIPGSGREIHRTPLRRLGGRVYGRLGAFAVGMRLADPQCGAKIFRRSEQLAELLRQPFSARWAFDVELLVRLDAASRGAHWRLIEVPLLEWRDVAESRLQLTERVRAFGELAVLAWNHRAPTEHSSVTIERLTEEKDPGG